ncbi:MAG: hypothetical protein N2746_09230 [Deltaproteobacteria bacterium]|nr:hypothetical protein [Deltaproteobacteria bacterium]
MIISPNVRYIAIQIIEKIIYGNQSRDTLVNEYFQGLNNREKNLAFNIILNTLRFKEVFDEIIKLELKIPIFKFDRLVLIAIEVYLAQFITMDKIPIYAAVSETIEAYKLATNNSRGTGFLNYSLKRLTDSKSLKEKFEIFKGDNNLLKSLIKELNKEIPEEEFQAIYKSSFEKPNTTIRIRTDIKQIKQRLLENSIEFEESKIVPQALIIKDSSIIKKISEILPQNSFVIQSELSQLAAYLLDIQDNDTVLDVCSGNQIKSTQIFEIKKGKVNITSIDIKNINEPKFQFINADAAKVKLNAQFDKIIIDAPCSGIGTLSQNPEIKFRLNRRAIKRFASIQYKILKNIANYLKREGNLLYSVCTLTKSETVNLIKNFIEENPQFEIIKPSMNNPKLRRFIDKDGLIKIFNYNNNSFFYALLKRK